MKKELFWAIAFWAFASFQAWRMIQMVVNHGVNILFWDQWDIYDPMFGRGPNDWYHLFFFQHGHGEGLGIILEVICNYWSHWDTRTESLFICCLFVLVFLVYAIIRRRFGPYTWFDLVWPLLCLTPLHWESVLVVPHLAYGPIPALLIALTALVWLIQSSWLRDGALLVLYFLTTYTGYGFFLGGFTPLLFITESYDAVREKKYLLLARKAILACATLTLLTVFIAESFLFNANAKTSKPPFSFDYIQFFLRMFSHLAGLDNPLFYLLEDHYHSEVLGFLICLVILYIIVTQFIKFVRYRDRLAFVLFSLSAFTLLYTMVSSYERLSLGLPSAYSSRYVSYMLPASFAFYFFLATRLNPGRIKTCVQICVLILFVQGGLLLGARDTTDMLHYQDKKKVWMENYLQTGSIEETDKLSDFPIYPFPIATGLKEKLQFLREHHLNLFKDTK